MLNKKELELRRIETLRSLSGTLIFKIFNVTIGCSSHLTL